MEKANEIKDFYQKKDTPQTGTCLREVAPTGIEPVFHA